MEALKTRFRSLLDKIDSLSLRERALVLIVMLVVFIGLWDTFFYQSISAEQKKLTGELNQVKTEIASQTTLAEQIRRKGVFDPNTTTRNQLASMQAQIDETRLRIDSGAGELISPQQMARALEDLLVQHGDMTLVSLETLPLTKLFEGGDSDEKEAENQRLQDLPVVYRHDLSIEIEGRYFETLNYLKALQALQWRFYWDTVDYQVKDYPLARIKINVYTLSFEEGWLGV